MTNKRDDWNQSGENVLSPGILSKVEQVLEQQGPIILEHRFYKGSSAPDRLVFDDYGDFIGYVKSHARPGDAFYFWSYAELCKDDNCLVRGKYPDALGRTPEGGAY